MSDSQLPDSTAGIEPRRRRIVLVGGAAVMVVAAAAIFIARGAEEVFTDNAYVHGNQVQLTSRVGGTVVAIHADNTDRVERGQVLVELDATDATLALQAAEANLAATVREVRQLFDSVSALAADVKLRRVELLQRQLDLQRRLETRSGSISQEELAHARSGVEAAQAAVESAEQRWVATRALVANTTEATHPRVLRAKAQFRDAYVNLERTRVLAPVDGYVARRSVQLGQRVDLATSMLTIVPLTQVWVEANLKEGQLVDVRIGQPATLTADFYGDDVVYTGRVVGLAAGTGSAFALLPPQNATGNWIKIVQRVPVRIELDTAQFATHPLRLGLSMQVRIETGDGSGPMLAGDARARPVYETPIYDDSLQGAEGVIDNIVQGNLAPRTRI
jgi:membrane fusion protein (multidrug efflux system)